LYDFESRYCVFWWVGNDENRIGYRGSLPFHYSVYWDFLSCKTFSTGRKVPFCRIGGLEVIDLRAKIGGKEGMQSAISDEMARQTYPVLMRLVRMESTCIGCLGDTLSSKL
jgi:hypothetical protein